MSLNLLITIIIVISSILIYVYSNHMINKRENFENLPQANKEELSSAIRKDKGLESQIDAIANQITKREEHYKSIERQYMKDGDMLMKKSVSIENIDNEDTPDMIQGKLVESIQDNKVEAVKPDLTDYIHKSDIPDMSKYVPKSVLKKYVKKKNVPNLSKYILRTQVPSMPNLNKYILRSQVPECPTQPDMSHFIKKTEIPQPVRCPDLTKFVLKTSVPPCNKPVCPTPVCPKPNCMKCDAAPVLSEEPVVKKIIKKPVKKAIDSSQIVQTINLPKKFFQETNKAKKEETDKKVNKISEDSDKIQKMIDQYKPKVEEKKCTFFRRIVKNADVYGAY